MQYVSARLAENRPLQAGFFVLSIEGCEALEKATPGQFVMLRGDWGRDPLLPRAFSLLRTRPGRAEILVKTVGRGSALLEHAPAGSRLFVLGPLGHGFPAPSPHTRELLIAGGVGLAPLLWHAEWHRGHLPGLELFYGARTHRELVLTDEIAASGARLFAATEDGSAGVRGYVTFALETRLAELAQTAERPRLLACGPTPMLEAVRRIAESHQLPCFLSLEGEMACGIGACLGCAVAAKAVPYLYVCKHGPVLDAKELR
jgi:dihydroorotate dehydrogenase electron transfer subunit